MAWAIIVLLLVLWLIGMLAGIGGNFIHLLLAAALAVLIVNIISLRRTDAEWK